MVLKINGYLSCNYFNFNYLYSLNYHPFGMVMPGRGFSSGTYRFGFNGQEKDDEINGVGSSLNFGARILDTRIGKWYSIDPLQKTYPNLSPYCSMGNNPIRYVDSDGKKLFLSGAQSRIDIMNLVPPAYRDRVTITLEGEVLVNMSANTQNPVIIKTGSAGLELLSKLSEANENYLYQTTNTLHRERPSDGNTQTVDLTKVSTKGMNNWSDTKRSPKNLREFLKFSQGTAPHVSDDTYRPLVDESQRCYEGIITISPDMKYTDSGGEKRNGVVFHELWENYERTTNKKPYGIPYFDANGNGKIGTDFDYVFDRSKGGAHNDSENAEGNFHDRSAEPGKATVEKKHE